LSELDEEALRLLERLAPDFFYGLLFSLDDYDEDLLRYLVISTTSSGYSFLVDGSF